MRLLRAQFENFRLLRDLELEFSNDPQRKLTIIRAANESGKTTLLHALQWGLYGDDALPGKGDEFRLHPIDWDTSGGHRVPISVTIEFEVVKYNNIRGTTRESRSKYRIIRSAYEELNGSDWARSQSTVRLLALTENGATPIDSPEALINEELPIELREVFFTDGDRALSFIESDVSLSTKRDRVQRAIRALLGLGVIEESIKHVKKAAADVNRHARTVGGGGELSRVAAALDERNNEIAKLEAAVKDAHQQFTAFDEKLSEIDKKIDETLKKGDREKLGTELEATKRTVARLDEALAVANRSHSQLFRMEALAADILSPVLDRAFQQLTALYDKGKIPNTTIPVLEERLGTALCICGESLVEDGGDGSRRRHHIHKLIDDSRKADEVQSFVTDLYYNAKTLTQRKADKENGWIAHYAKVVDERDRLHALREQEGSKLKSLEVQIDNLPDTDIQALRETQRNYREQRDRFNANKAKAETQLDSVRRDRQQLEVKRDGLLREQTRGARILSELDAVADIQAVLEKAYHRITSEELAKVSALMNAMFLEMIGADPEQGAIIKRAEINREFDIVVLGPSDRTLNPDRDLNGASRRALTIAFILALTKVSEVEAPNVIDTPLGMMSGYVKRSVLRIAIRESSQLVLFLTHSEIAGCEEILGEYAGATYTLTNSAHYPTMLVNDPGIRERKILLCKCAQDEHCHRCERRTEDVSVPSLEVA